MESAFTSIYQTKAWEQKDVSKEFSGSSGNGSSLEYNKFYITFLRHFIRQQKIQSVVDIGCGDWRCGKAIYDGLNVKYTGYDVYGEMVSAHQKNFPDYEFIHADGKNYKVADLCIIKDVIQHWSNKDVLEFLSNLRCKYTLIVNCGKATGCPIVHDILTGQWRQLQFPAHPIWKGIDGKLIFSYNTKEAVLIEKKV